MHSIEDLETKEQRKTRLKGIEEGAAKMRNDLEVARKEYFRLRKEVAKCRKALSGTRRTT